MSPQISNAEFKFIDDPQLWDSFVVRSPQGHFLQSYGWGKFKSLFGWSAQRVAVEGQGEILAGVQILFRPTPLGLVAYVPRGPVVEPDQAELASQLHAILIKLAKEKGAIFLKVEPNISMDNVLLNLGFRSSQQTIQPKSTIVVDLTPDLPTIAARQKSKTRYNIGLAARKGVEVREGTVDDLPAFYALMRETGARDSFLIRPLDYFRQMMKTLGESVRLFLAYYQGEVLAGILVSIFVGEAIYLYGASGNAHRNLMPNHLLQWEAMKWAKAQGCTRYDLWGIPGEVGAPSSETNQEPEAGSEAPKGGLWGVYRFKLGFGGDVVRCPGAFDYPHSPLRYWLWTNLIPKLKRLRSGQGE